MSSPIRFWGTVAAVKPRLVLAKFEDTTTPRCEGHLIALEGTRTEGDAPPVAGRFVVAIGPATQEKRRLGVGDLLRGDAHPAPVDAPDLTADLYKVGTLRVLARGGDPGTPPPPAPDPPRTDPPLTAEGAEAAPRRPLEPDQLEPDGVCAPCPYGVVVPVVRLVDPRDWRGGRWAQVPACLGPTDCPYYAAPE